MNNDISKTNKNGDVNFLPIILGSDENAYGIARAFHEKYNQKSLILCKQRLVATRYSKIVEIICIENFDKNEIFVNNITEIATKKLINYEKLILIPCSDRYTELCAKNKDLLEKYFCNKFISAELLDKFVTKEKFYEICEQYNFAYPRTIVCEYSEREEILSKFKELKIDFPIVLKANNSNSYDFLHSKFDGKKKVFFVNSSEEYRDIIGKMSQSNYKDNLIIQEFIPGDDSFMRVLNCFSNNQGKVKLMCMGQPILEEYAPLAIGNYAAIMTESVIDSKLNIEIFAKIKGFLEDIKYTGFSNFDMKFDTRTGEYKLFEINPRQGRSSFFVTASGYNLAEFLVDNCVYNLNKELIYGNGEQLWLSVPKKIIYKYVKNNEILSKAKKLIAEKKYKYTLFYKQDLSFKRWLRIKLYYDRHIKEYKKYFFEK